MDLGKRIRKVREEKGISQVILSRASGIHVTALQMIEKGLVLPRSEDVVKLAESLGVALDALFPAEEGFGCPQNPPEVNGDAADENELAAQRILDFCNGIDPAWSERLRAVREERGFSPLQTVGAFVGYVLDNSFHMEIPTHPYFHDGKFAASRERECPECHQTFKALHPGQVCCSNPCGRVYFARQRGEVA